jgi:hypothetical protein
MPIIQRAVLAEIEASRRRSHAAPLTDNEKALVNQAARLAVLEVLTR